MSCSHAAAAVTQAPAGSRAAAGPDRRPVLPSGGRPRAGCHHSRRRPLPPGAADPSREPLTALCCCWRGFGREAAARRARATTGGSARLSAVPTQEADYKHIAAQWAGRINSFERLGFPLFQSNDGVPFCFVINIGHRYGYPNIGTSATPDSYSRRSCRVARAP